MQEDLREKLVDRLKEHLAGENSLRGKQPQVEQDIINYLDNPDNPTYGYIKRPTGSGKTASFLNAAVAMGERTLIIVPRKLLAQETAGGEEKNKGFLDPAYKLGVNPNDIGIYDSDQSVADRTAALGKKYLVTTYSSFVSLAKTGRISSDPGSGSAYFPVIMLDEVHRARGDVIRPRIDPFLDNSLVLGWTASDKFADGTNVGDVVFRGKKPIHVTTVKDAIEADEISSFKTIVVKVKGGVGARTASEPGDYSIKEQIERIAPKPGEDFTRAQIERIVNKEDRDELAVRLYANYHDEDTGIAFRGKSTICYCGGVKHAKRLADKFNEALKDVFPPDVTPAVVITGDTPKKDVMVEGKLVEGRDTILKKYREGKIKVLCNADLLIEGFDAKIASLCFMMVPTASPITAEQTGGRVLRINEKDPNKFAYIVNMMDEGVEGGILFGKTAGSMVIKTGEEARQKQLRGDSEKFAEIEMPPHYAKADRMDVISKFEDLEAIRTAVPVVSGAPILEKTPEWLTIPELCSALNERSKGNRFFSPISPNIAELAGQLRANVPRDGDIVRFNLPEEQSLESSWRMVTPYVKPQICVRQPGDNVLDYLQTHYGAAEARTGWKTRQFLKQALAQKVKINNAPRVFEQFWNSVHQELAKHGGEERKEEEYQMPFGDSQLRIRYQPGTGGKGAAVYTDDAVIDLLAKTFLEAHVPSTHQSGPLTHGYFTPEQLMEIVGSHHQKAVEDMFRFLASELDKSLPVYGVGTMHFENIKNTTVHGSFVAESRSPANFRLYIPEQDSDKELAGIKKLMSVFEESRAEVERKKSLKRTVFDQIPNAKLTENWFPPTYLARRVTDSDRPVLLRLAREWKEQLMEIDPPFENNITLPGGEVLRMSLRKYDGYMQACLYFVNDGTGNVAPLLRILKPALDQARKRFGDAAAINLPPVEAGETVELMDLKPALRTILGESFDHGEFSEMTTRLRRAAGAKNCELRLPPEEGTTQGALIKMKINHNGNACAFLPEGKKDETLKALADYMYDIEDKAPPVRESVQESAAGGESPTKKLRAR